VEGDKAYNTDNKTSKEAFDQAIANYQAVIAKGFPILTDNTKKETDASLALADGLKAGVAVRDDYAKAKAVYDNAVAEQEAGNYEKAIELFQEADDLFQQVYEKAKAKKAKAEGVIQEALDSLKASEEKAKEAEDAMTEGEE
jgi:tetratricopeptide (TPR) repeat protein